jgi:hypothetical protein
LYVSRVRERKRSKPGQRVRRSLPTANSAGTEKKKRFREKKSRSDRSAMVVVVIIINREKATRVAVGQEFTDGHHADACD